MTYLTTPPPHTPLDPLTTFLPHTTSASPIRRLGTASLLKNTALLHPDIPYLLQPAASILPPILLPLCSSNQEAFSEDEMDALPEVCQYLGNEHVREKDVGILKMHLETLFLLCTRGGGGEGRRLVKGMGTYPVIRELHLEVEDEGVRRGCERLVDVLMGDDVAGGSSHESAGGVGGSPESESTVRHERGGGIGMGTVVTEDRSGNEGAGRMVTQVEEEDEDEDEDDVIVPIF